MRLPELLELTEGQLLVDAKEDVFMDRAYAADLLSDVLALTDEQTTLITGTISPQVIRVAEILSIVAIIFVGGKQPSNTVLEYARRLGIPIISTQKTMFETCGLMYAEGVRPCKNTPMPQKKASA